MFEKEAKKWVKENSRIEHSASFGEIAVEPSAEKGFQKGAEFGYNKANEWHYMKDGYSYCTYEDGECIKISVLEKENAELKNKLEHRNCLDCSNHSSKLRMRTLELEKENAELKAGGPKWYTPDEKLPEECTTVVAYGFDDIEPTTYHFVCSDQWEWLPRRIAVLSNEQIKKWCNIPMK